MGRPKVPPVEVTQEYLRSVLEYCPECGRFTWKDGKPAGAPKDSRGYIRIDFPGHVRLYAHRVAFIYMTGSCPKFVDHADENKANNAWGNLRPATKSQNGMNRGKNKNNSSGFKGVYYQTNGYTAELRKDGRKYYLGRFRTPEAAAEAVKNARIEIHGEFARCV